MALDEQHHFTCRGQRVLPPAHWHGTGMSREARHARIETRPSGDGGDDADRQAFVQQHGPLLDMRLDIGDDILAAPIDVAPAVGITAECLERFAHRDAGVVRFIEPRGIEPARHGLAAD